MPSALSAYLIAATLLLGPATAQAQTQAQTPTQTTPGPVIDGFRSAKFGMTEPQIRAAIEADFKKSPAAITASENTLQHTPILTIQVPNLVPEGGAAAISYIFGYTSHKLMEVNITWSPQIDPKTTATTLYQTGETLQQYFSSENFPAGRSIGNIATQNGVILFRATDAAGNAVLLVLAGAITKDQKTSKTILTPTNLTLAYAADPAHPDIYQLPKGAF